ncbi:unnamed protein product [Symbiodinium natans]|uniref:Uncharacterized protein n=1 Tax=Symbiodinium natans TaxID=878477 RepID=A0A812LBU3_9DINO|nr:unnamed protein product [Symbiodinium natans]
MNFSPELSVALQRITACNNNDRLASVVRGDLLKSLQESNDAVLHAHEAWMQLEMLGTDVNWIGGVVDLFDKESLFKAFKDSKLLTRDRVVWQAIGRFRNPLDMQLTMDYLSELVSNNNTQVSQLRNSYYKIQSDMVLQVMRDYYSWERFALQIFSNYEDDDVQFVLFNLSRFMELNMADLYTSLMQSPFIVADALSRAAHDGVPVRHAGSGAHSLSDTASLFQSLASLGRDLSYPDFLDPVKDAIHRSTQSSLRAIQHSVTAWSLLHQEAPGSGVLTSDDGQRKFRDLDFVMRQELLCTSFAFLGANGLADFGLVEQVLRQHGGLKDGPNDTVDGLVAKLRTTHSHMQKHFLQELICSENVWSRSIKKITQLQAKETRGQN